MSWRDDFRAAYDAVQPSYPEQFLESWARHEEPDNADEQAPLRGQVRGEVGWFQIHPGTAEELGIDIDRVLADQRYSMEAGAMMIDSYASRTPAGFTGTAWWAMLKLWHALPLLAKKVISGMTDGAGSWREVRDWIEQNVRSSDIDGHSPAKWVRNVQEVLDDAGPLPEAMTVTGIGPITAVLLIVGVVGLVGLAVVYA